MIRYVLEVITLTFVKILRRGMDRSKREWKQMQSWQKMLVEANGNNRDREKQTEETFNSEDLAFNVIYKKSLSNLRFQKFPPVFYQKFYMVQGMDQSFFVSIFLLFFFLRIWLSSHPGTTC